MILGESVFQLNLAQLGLQDPFTVGEGLEHPTYPMQI